MQLIWTQTVATYLLKNDEHEIKHDVDSAYGACIHLAFQHFTADSLNYLHFKQMINLTVL